MKAMVWCAMILIALRFSLAALGGEEATRFLAGNAVDELELSIGALFVLVHLAAIVAAPILLIASAARAMIQWFA